MCFCNFGKGLDEVGGHFKIGACEMIGHLGQDWQEVDDVVIAVDHELVGAAEEE